MKQQFLSLLLEFPQAWQKQLWSSVCAYGGCSWWYKNTYIKSEECNRVRSILLDTLVTEDLSELNPYWELSISSEAVCPVCELPRVSWSTNSQTASSLKPKLFFPLTSRCRVVFVLFEIFHWHLSPMKQRSVNKTAEDMMSSLVSQITI